MVSHSVYFNFIATFFALISLVHAASSNYAPFSLALPAFSKECLYFDLTSHEDSIVVSYQVLTGGNFEIDFEIIAPDESQIVAEKQKKYSDFLLKSFGLGQYTFCFSNSYGTAMKKVEVVLELEKGNLGIPDENSSPQDAVSNNAIEEIDRNLQKITKAMNYLRAREWRNMYTVESTNSRLTWLSLLIMGLTVGISIVQSVVIQFFFKVRSRNYV